MSALSASTLGRGLAGSYCQAGSTALLLQKLHCFGTAGQYLEEGASRPRRAAFSLFPVAQSGKRDINSLGKFFLCQEKTFADIPNMKRRILYGFHIILRFLSCNFFIGCGVYFCKISAPSTWTVYFNPDYTHIFLPLWNLLCVLR